MREADDVGELVEHDRLEDARLLRDRGRGERLDVEDHAAADEVQPAAAPALGDGTADPGDLPGEVGVLGRVRPSR